MLKIKQKDIDRFWSKVKKTKGCWDWTGHKHRQGYGFIDINSIGKLAHRISWIINKGNIPKNLFVLHKCDNPSCVNPGHLFLGTQTDNMRDMFKKNRNADVSGEKNPNRILSKLDVLKIRKLLKLRISYKEIAKKFGISYGNVNNIVSGYAWKNIC